MDNHLESNDYYLSFLKNTNYLKDNTKTLYLKKIEIIISKIIKNPSLKFIIENPELFYNYWIMLIILKVEYMKH